MKKWRKESLFLVSQGREEVQQESFALLGKDAGAAQWVMIEGHHKEIGDRTAAACAFIFSTINDAANTGIDDRTCTHGTGFQCYIQLAVGEPPSAKMFAGVLDGKDFGVSGSRRIDLAAVIAATDDLIVLDNDSADRDLS